MIQAIIEQTDESKKFQMVVYDHLGGSKKAWCECCGEQGHKFYECPERLLGNANSIYCSLCGSNNHPTTDCPEKSKSTFIFDYFTLFLLGKKKQIEEITPEEELHNFLQDIKQEKEQREKYKMITGKEAPRNLNMAQFQAE